jgi:hypothetical protein
MGYAGVRGSFDRAQYNAMTNVKSRKASTYSKRSNKDGYTPMTGQVKDSSRKSLMKNPFAALENNSPNGHSDESFDDGRESDPEINGQIQVNIPHEKTSTPKRIS